ncbi:MAG TPA: MaoC family dehydratase [Solirubrobacteraceae bacterium]|nr:MaoC family dehydratase [Solirubrobacteraceae bacterium]
MSSSSKSEDEGPGSPPAAAAPPSKSNDRPVSGRWLEDLPEGLVVRHAITRTITETDNILFTTLSMNPAPMHLDAHFAAQSEFGRVLVNSMLTLALLVGISVHELTMGTTVANLGFEQVTFPAPLFHGDTLSAESEVISSRRSRSRPRQGVVLFEHRGFNQDGVLVVGARRNALMHARP